MTVKKYILTADDVEDNLTSHLQDVPLSANMGRELKALIDSGGGGGVALITATAGANGMISPIGEIGVIKGESKTFTITPNSGYAIDDVKVDGVSVGKVDTYTFENVQGNHTLRADFIVIPQRYYTFTINKATASTSPTTCVSYSEGVSTASQAYEVAKRWIVPTVVKNGQVNYYLYRKDLSKKATDETGDVSAGTASTLTGTDGDVCASICPLWWKVITNDANSLTIRISDGAFSGAMSAHKFNGTIRKYLHVGMFHSTAQACTSIYSTSAKPKADVTHDNFRSSTEARGDTYNIMTYLTWTLLDIIWVFASGSTDSQTTIGQDYTGGSATTYVSTSAMLTADGYTSSTKSSTTTSLMYLYIANPWGSVRDWVAGLKAYGGSTGVVTDQKDARGVTVDAAIPSAWTKFTTPTLTSSNYIKEVLGSTEAPFFPKTGGASTSTYYCDYGYSKSGTYCGNVGGYYDDGGTAGAFRLYVYYSSSRADAFFGARLQVLDVNPAT